MVSAEHHFAAQMRACDPDLEDGGADAAWIAAAGAVAAGTIVTRQQSVGSAQPASSSAPPGSSSGAPGSSTGHSRHEERAAKRVTKKQNRLVNKKLCAGLVSAGIPANALTNPEFKEALYAIAKFGPKFDCMDSTECYRRYVH